MQLRRGNALFRNSARGSPISRLATLSSRWRPSAVGRISCRSHFHPCSGYSASLTNGNTLLVNRGWSAQVRIGTPVRDLLGVCLAAVSGGSRDLHWNAGLEYLGTNGRLREPRRTSVTRFGTVEETGTTGTGTLKP
jgi:hypothetical protein